MFSNRAEQPLDPSFLSTVIGVSRAAFCRSTFPSKALPVINMPDTFIPDNSVTWLGHSTLYVKIDGVKLLIDPVIDGSNAKLKGVPTYALEQPIRLPTESIDAVLISHNHQDHLDDQLISKLRFDNILTPLGNKSYFQAENQSVVQELDWFEACALKSLKITLTPAKHFSGLSKNDKNAALWGGFVIQSKNCSIYYTGDTGYSESDINQVKAHFPAPFDLLINECGAYSKHWPNYHCFPEQIAKNVQALSPKALLPVHCCHFQFSDVKWNDGLEWLYMHKNELGCKLYTPEIGQFVRFDKEEADYSNVWWRRYL